jgi:acetoin utilization deacetylase AcuC-like enzyme
MLVMNGPHDDSAHEEAGHPERPDRIGAALEGVNDLHLGSDLILVEPYAATRSELTRVHESTYLDELGAFCYAGGGDLDEDTYATYDSWSIAQYAAGAGLAVIKELQRLGDGVGFVATRPPGHHALRDRAMGFCLLNNIAVSAASLIEQGERVLIVDWDVHHGNGTQAIFWDKPEVMYVSTHQSPLFPGSGASYEIGGMRALGSTINVPVPPGSTGDVIRRAIEEVAGPKIDAFDPTWVLVSAGFDSHRDDPMADLALTSGDFARLATLVAGFSPRQGRLALFLEGGYDLGALRTSVASSLSAVLAGSYESEAPSSGGPGHHMIEDALTQREAALRIANDAASKGDY